MYTYLCDRRQFVDYIVNRTPLNLNDNININKNRNFQVPTNQIMIVCKESPAKTFSLPHAIIINEDSLTDFLAWVSTYFRNIRPFTAHTRVITPTVAQILYDQNKTEVAQGIELVEIGLIIAEATIYSLGKSNPKNLPYTALNRTLSFALAKGWRNFGYLGNSTEIAFTSIADGWLSARNITNQLSLPLPTQTIREIWSMIRFYATGKNSSRIRAKSKLLIIEALKEINNAGSITEKTWHSLSKDMLDSNYTYESFNGPVEGRVKAIEKAIRDVIDSSKNDQSIDAFVLGYLVSRIQPGSLNHFAVLESVRPNLLESMLWYGVCAGLSPDSTVPDFASGIGWIVKRELGRTSSWEDRPTCDIALPELKMYFQNGEKKKLDFRGTTKNNINIEIFPLIDTSIKWYEQIDHEKRKKDISQGKQKTLFRHEETFEGDISDLLKVINGATSSLQEIRLQIELKIKDKKLKNK